MPIKPQNAIFIDLSLWRTENRIYVITKTEMRKCQKTFIFLTFLSILLNKLIFFVKRVTNDLKIILSKLSREKTTFAHLINQNTRKKRTLIYYRSKTEKSVYYYINCLIIINPSTKYISTYHSQLSRPRRTRRGKSKHKESGVPRASSFASHAHKMMEWIAKVNFVALGRLFLSFTGSASSYQFVKTWFPPRWTRHFAKPLNSWETERENDSRLHSSGLSIRGSARRVANAASDRTGRRCSSPLLLSEKHVSGSTRALLL